MTSDEEVSSHAKLAAAVLEDAWCELRHSLEVQQMSGAAALELPDLSLWSAQRKSAAAKSLLKRVEAIDCSQLPHDLALSLRLVRFRAQVWSQEASWYWTVIDPLGNGFFGLFLPTAYCGGLLLGGIHGLLAAFQFREPGDTDRYLDLADQYGHLINQLADRTRGQALRGIRMPRVQIPQARELLSSQALRVEASIGVDPRRLVDITDAKSFSRELSARVRDNVLPAYAHALQEIGDEYFERAPEAVGLGQYPDGDEIYRSLVACHTTTSLTPHEVHARGHSRMAEIQQAMKRVRQGAGFDRDGVEFMRRLNQDERWRTSSVEGVRSFFQRYIDRMERRLPEAFAELPKARYETDVLPTELESSMTYGYYDSPRGPGGTGRYLFNSSNLTRQSLFSLAALTYHELMPGHHLQLALQQENSDLHPFRRFSLINAYNEGWAEYAATLAGEMGLYEEPEEQYGRLLNDAFLTARLVVDTGMNALGWSLESARKYLREFTGMTETEIVTESIRYSCDIPGQSLAYKLGEDHIVQLRRDMRERLGAEFNLKDFHAAVLSAGAIPLADLAWHAEDEMRRAIEDRRETGSVRGS